MVGFRTMCVGGMLMAGCQAAPAAPSETAIAHGERVAGPGSREGEDLYIKTGADGDGTETTPFGSIQDGLDAAVTGDTLVVAEGTYHESLVTRRAGVRVVGSGSVTITALGRVLDVQHSTTFENLSFDGQFGPRDTIRVRAHDVRFLGVEVFNSGRDGIDAGDVSGLLVENAHIHDCIWSGRDAHGIVGGRLTGAVVRNSRIHDVTGDGIQLDAARSPGDWDIRVEDVDIWDTGEDGIDTKTGGAGRLTVVGGSFRGFRGKTNSAAFNMKESVTATIEGVMISDAEIGFRLRYPANVRLSAATIADSGRGIRYEDGVIEHPRRGVTFVNVDREIQRAN